MKKFLMIALLTAPLIGLAGCQDASTQGELANLKSKVATLEDKNKELNDKLAGMPRGENGEPADVGALLTRLERQQREIDEANKRLADLEKQTILVPPVDLAAPEGEVAYSEADLARHRAIDEKLRAEREAARQAEREKRQAEQVAEGKRLAEKYGFEFDENDPRGSIMKIMSDPAQRAKAMEAMRTEMTERRLEPLKLDEFQKKEVLRIEDESRTKMRDAMTKARENGATPEEMQAELKTIQDDQKTQLGGVLTPEQMEEYEKSGAQMGGMIPGMGGGGGWGGMIPGFGGGGR